LLRREARCHTRGAGTEEPVRDDVPTALLHAGLPGAYVAAPLPNECLGQDLAERRASAAGHEHRTTGATRGPVVDEAQPARASGPRGPAARRLEALSSTVLGGGRGVVRV